MCISIIHYPIPTQVGWSGPISQASFSLLSPHFPLFGTPDLAGLCGWERAAAGNVRSSPWWPCKFWGWKWCLLATNRVCIASIISLTCKSALLYCRQDWLPFSVYSHADPCIFSARIVSACIERFHIMLLEPQFKHDKILYSHPTAASRHSACICSVFILLNRHWSAFLVRPRRSVVCALLHPFLLCKYGRDGATGSSWSWRLRAPKPWV